MEQERIVSLYQSIFGKQPLAVDRLPGAGSNRIYYRITEDDESTLIGVYGTSAEENRAFYNLALLFAARHLPVPAVYAISDDSMCYLQEDLGSTSLFDFIRRGRESDGKYDGMEEIMLQLVISELPQFQFEAASEYVYEQCYPTKYFDETSIMFDLNYFKYCYLKLTGVEFHEIRLEEDFRRLCADLLAVKEVGFMYRDFQARNVMLKEGRPFYIDFQGGRRGPIYYDVASFLWQASAKYSDELRQKLIDQYITSAHCYMEIDKKDFMQKLHLFVLFRTLQVLGAYGFRGLWEKKQHFIDSIPQALQNLSHCIAHGCCDAYPYLKEISLLLIDENSKTQKLKNSKTQLISSLLASDTTYCKKSDTPLVVDVYSFSYKKGIPEDASGNGGGYVFDCRSTHNPGRYEQYKQITGLDQPVIDFLEEDGEILTFLESVYRLVDFHVQRFIDRGFSHLMLSFGCTGGQHRSVYSAQHVAEHIHHKFGIEVHIHHCEQNIENILPPLSDSPLQTSPRGGFLRPEGLKCLILAAGLGTRLKPLTDTMPKALVPVANKPLLEHLIDRLKASGCTDIVVNVHHFAQQIIDFLAEKQNFGIHIQVSDERDQLLETGGAIKKAGPLFTDGKPFLVHNVDIFHNLDLHAFYHTYSTQADAVLLVSQRDTQRYLLFNDRDELVGWTNIKTGEVKSPFPSVKSDITPYRKLAFSGIQIFSPSLLPDMASWQDRFSIIDFYLQSCATHRIIGVEKDDLRLLDVGKIDSLTIAEEFFHTPMNLV